MIPTNSSITTNGCDNISSNCVIWQGPDIACIDLCTGDTISIVTKKIADKVCQIITDGVTANPDLTGLDLSCLNIQGVTPTELVPVLQAMVTQICANTNSSGGGGMSPLPTMTLPACLVYDDPSGNPVTQLPLDQFATLIANQVCTNLTSITTINATLTSYNTRITTLENCVLPCGGSVAEVQIVPTCVSNVGQLTNVSVVVLALESAFCALQTAVGLPGAISSAISQTVITGSYNTLTDNSVSYGSIVGWNNSPSTLAESVQNAWVVIDDLYSAVAAIQTNCCPSGCDSVVFAYSTSTQINTSGVITGINFDFTGSTIPASFNDTSGYSIITLTDANGASTNTVFSVASLQNNPTGLLVSTGTLNTFQNIQVAISFSVTDGSDTCEAAQNSVVNGVIPCPTMLSSAITTTEATISFGNLLGTSAVYTLDLLDVSNNVVATQVFNNPGVSLTHTFTGLTPGSNYTARLTIGIGGATEVCANTINFTTVNGAAPCTDGMDVAFVIDYTASMGTEINSIKTGFASLVNTIQTSSGANNYRIGVTTADEYTDPTTQPTYSACADYQALPASQRIINTGIGHTQVITAWEMFSDNNGASATTQVNLLNDGVGDGTGCIQLGNGGGAPEPTDMAINQILNNNFLGAWRPNVAKYIIVITDELSGGPDDSFTAVDYAQIQTFINQALAQGVTIFVLGEGVDKTFNNGGTLVYPWRELADQTGGSWNINEDPSTINAEIVAGCS